MADGDEYEVHLLGIRALESVPGKTTFERLKHVEDTIEASREYDGIRFYCLLTGAQYEALKAS